MYVISRFIRGTILINYSLLCNMLDYIFFRIKIKVSGNKLYKSVYQ